MQEPKVVADLPSLCSNNCLFRRILYLMAAGKMFLLLSMHKSNLHVVLWQASVTLHYSIPVLLAEQHNINSISRVHSPTHTNVYESACMHVHTQWIIILLYSSMELRACTNRKSMITHEINTRELWVGAKACRPAAAGWRNLGRISCSAAAHAPDI